MSAPVGCSVLFKQAGELRGVRCVQAGCTAVVAVLKGQELWVANAGDSRAVLCRGGQALALSEDHKPQSEGERNRITAAGGFVSDVGGVSRCVASSICLFNIHTTPSIITTHHSTSWGSSLHVRTMWQCDSVP